MSAVSHVILWLSRSCETYRLVWMAGNTKRARSYILFRFIGSREILSAGGAVVYQALSF